MRRLPAGRVVGRIRGHRRYLRRIFQGELLGTELAMLAKLPLLIKQRLEESRPDANFPFCSLLMKKSEDPKRRPVNLSLTPEEKRVLDWAAGRARQKSTSFATTLYRHALLRYLCHGASMEALLGESMPQGFVEERIARQPSVKYYLTDEGHMAFQTESNETILIDLPSASGTRSLAELQAAKGRSVHEQHTESSSRQKRPRSKAS